MVSICTYLFNTDADKIFVRFDEEDKIFNMQDEVPISERDNYT